MNQFPSITANTDVTAGNLGDDAAETVSNSSHSSHTSHTSHTSSRASTPGRASGRYSSEYVTHEENEFVDRALSAGFNNATAATHVDVDLDYDIELEMDGAGGLSSIGCLKGFCRCRCRRCLDATGTVADGTGGERGVDDHNKEARRRLIANQTCHRASVLAQVLVLADRLLLTAVRRPMQIALQYLGSIGLAVALSAGELASAL